MTTAELLACPFCGGEARVCSYSSCDCCGKNYNAGVACTRDGCSGTVDHFDTDEEAITAWNTRPQLPAADGVDAWLPIDSAPKGDGTILIGWGEYREREGFGPAFMRWYDSINGWAVNCLPFYPTHWQPRPMSPQDAAIASRQGVA